MCRSGPDEGEVVVAAVPQDQVGLGLGRGDDRRVVDAGEDHVAAGEVRLVFLALLERAAGGVEVGALAKRCTAWRARSP
jgi:hypothetical protein